MMDGLTGMADTLGFIEREEHIRAQKALRKMHELEDKLRKENKLVKIITRKGIIETTNPEMWKNIK